MTAASAQPPGVPSNAAIPRSATNRWLVIIDFAAVAAIYIADRLGFIPLSTTPFLLAVGWISLRLRRLRWRDVGLVRYHNWSRTIVVGTWCGIALAAFQLLVTQPLISRAFGSQPDLSQFHGLKGNLPLTLALISLSWALAAFGEELVYRGYLMNRLADLVRGRDLPWIFSAVAVSVLFGFGHDYQGGAGAVVEGLAGLWLALLYLATGRNLFIPIMAHGIQNTVDFSLIFLGKFPGM